MRNRVTHTVQITNPCEGELVLEKLYVSQTEHERSLRLHGLTDVHVATDESAVFQITLDTFEPVRFDDDHVVIVSNDPDREVVMIELMGTVTDP